MNNNFIEAKELLKQPIEIQQKFIDWWKPKVGDLFELHIVEYNDYGEGSEEQTVLRKDEYNIIKSISENMLKESKENMIDMIKDVNCADRFTLCLNMSQLIDYIEDNSLCKIDIEYSPRKEKGYRINFYKIVDTEYGERCDFLSKRENLGHNLLQALWKVACKIEKDK